MHVQIYEYIYIQAINCLIYWAALTYNPKLTKILWRHCDDPMVMATIVSMIWNTLKKQCRDQDMKDKLEKSAKYVKCHPQISYLYNPIN